MEAKLKFKKNWLTKLYQHHVLANLAFIVTLTMGAISYFSLPREQNPSINFNWIQITTIYPGAAAHDVEELVTNPLEDAIRTVSDIRFVSSNSREGVSNILVRFNDISARSYDKRINDLRREIQNAEVDFPAQVKTQKVIEINSANSFPTATLVVVAPENDERLRASAKAFKDDIERIPGVDRVEAFGLNAPELQVLFEPNSLRNQGINAIDLVASIKSHFRDISAGTQNIGDREWLIRWLGKERTPENLAKIPVIDSNAEIQLGEVATVQRGRETSSRLVNYKGQHAIMLSVMKQAEINTLALVDSIKAFIDERNQVANVTGIRLVLLDDQSPVTRSALTVMQTNAIIGLCFVLLSTWFFLGLPIATLVSIGIPFSLAATFWILDKTGNTLNISVLLGVVIVLGMLVDDAVVVVESIYHYILKGQKVLEASILGIMEVFAPVTTSILTTIAVFLPLMLLPGILGKFMQVIPTVVTIALTVSLFEAYWILPAHINAFPIASSLFTKASKRRQKVITSVRRFYLHKLIYIFKYPKTALAGLVLIMLLALSAVISGVIPVNFFANDPLRLFYVNVEMPPGGSLADTLEQTKIIETKVRKFLQPHEVRSVTSYAGLMFSKIEPRLGDQYGQISVSLKPMENGMRTVDEVIKEMRDTVLNTAGPLNISFLRIAGGPPIGKPINIKVRGLEYKQIRNATNILREFLTKHDHTFDISDDDNYGRKELILKPNTDAIRRADLKPGDVARLVHLLTDGEIIDEFRDAGEKVEVRVQASPKNFSGISDLLAQTVVFNNKEIRLSELVTTKLQPGISNIRHYNFRRTITLTADINKEKIDTVTMNKQILAYWKKVHKQFPEVDLNFTGELDDIQESIDAMPKLFLLGVGLIYLILGTQFRSYWQPLMILSTIPLAFTGATFGLFFSQNPFSLYTLYGIIALSGITVNASIVLISAANQRLAAGMTVIQATFFAAKRRLVPILITSVTTIAGLFSLAIGLGGSSLLWGPVATAIVWGLIFSTLLTLMFMPLLYYYSHRKWFSKRLQDI